MRKKRRKAVYVPYDYEAAYKNSLDKMEEANEERILKEGKVKSIYATKEIRSGDQLEVETVSYTHLTLPTILRV